MHATAGLAAAPEFVQHGMRGGVTAENDGTQAALVDNRVKSARPRCWQAFERFDVPAAASGGDDPSWRERFKVKAQPGAADSRLAGVRAVLPPGQLPSAAAAKLDLEALL